MVAIAGPESRNNDLALRAFVDRTLGFYETPYLTNAHARCRKQKIDVPAEALFRCKMAFHPRLEIPHSASGIDVLPGRKLESPKTPHADRHRDRDLDQQLVGTRRDRISRRRTG